MIKTPRPANNVRRGGSRLIHDLHRLVCVIVAVLVVVVMVLVVFMVGFVGVLDQLADRLK